MNLNLDEKDDPKMRSNDRILVLEPIDGLKAKSSTGMVDPRLYQGGNKLHCIMDEDSCLWFFKLDHGILPEPLRQRWTSFHKALEFAIVYFNSRNLNVVRVED